MDKNSGNVKVTLVRSLIAAKPGQKLTAKSMGLKRIGDNLIHKDDEVIAGKIRVVSHLVKVERV